MNRFTDGVIIVEAVRLFPRRKLPPGVFLITDFRKEAYQYYLHVPTGLLMVNEKDFIVFPPEGDPYVMIPKDFRRKFKRID